MATGREHFFVVRDLASREKSGWLKLGETWHGNTLSAYDAATGKLVTAPDADRYQRRLIHVRASPQAGFASKASEPLVLVAGDSTYRLNWHVGSIHQAPILAPGRPYDFVLIEHAHPRLHGARVWHDVFRVTSGDRVLFDCRVCEVHGGPLETKLIPTRHGYSPLPLPAALEARKHKFPHAESGRAVTCLPQEDEPAMTKIWICRACESAYQQSATGGARR